jgi:exosortase A-associated hydrolase 1
MKRRHIAFGCEGSALVGTLDEGDATTGLLIVSGGNEIRSGAWNGQAQLAARIAAEGYPVLRFDRRGVGDSEGGNGGFRTSAADIAAALGAFSAECPGLTRVIGFGNCDAASALMLSGGAGCSGLVLSNPWTIESDAEAPPPTALRDHYRRRLSDPRAVLRLLAGKVSIKKLAASLRGALRPAPPATSLAQETAAGIAGYSGEVRFLIAERDRTGQAFLAAWNGKDHRIRRCPGASHSYVEPAAQQWVTAQLVEVLRT